MISEEEEEFKKKEEEEEKTAVLISILTGNVGCQKRDPYIT
jgi:hypothetical protein